MARKFRFQMYITGISSFSCRGRMHPDYRWIRQIAPWLIECASKFDVVIRKNDFFRCHLINVYRLRDLRACNEGG
jgi:hypothetical protein